jgi:hypothetical protein
MSPIASRARSFHATGELFPVILIATSDKAHALRRDPRGAGACPEGRTMTEAATQWRLDVLSHADRLADAAHEQTADTNEARYLVHGVIARALADITGPVSRRDLDTDLGRALRRRAADA